MTITVNGIKYNLIDDCDTLLVKLENITYDYYVNDIDRKNIDEIDKDETALREAIENDDYAVMQTMWNKYHTLFKRYR